MDNKIFCPGCGKQVIGDEITNDTTNKFHCLNCNHTFQVEIEESDEAAKRKARLKLRQTKRIKLQQASRIKKNKEVVRTSRIEAIKIKPKRSLYSIIWIVFGVVGFFAIFIATWLLYRTPVVEEKISVSEKNLTLSLDEIANLSEDEIDLATVGLKIAAEDFTQTYNKTLNVEKYLRKIDRFASLIQRNIDDKMEPEEVIATIADFLYHKQRFITSQIGWDPSNLYLNLILEGKQGYCLGFTQLWLALAERLKWRGKKLPLYGVYVPRHIFCRWHTKEKYINIETLHTPPEDYKSFLSLTFSRIFEIKENVKWEAARNLSDDFYIRMYDINSEAIKKGTYLKSLDKKGVISGIYSNRAVLQLDALKYAKNKEEYQIFLQNALHDSKKSLGWSRDNVLGSYNFVLICMNYFQDYKQAEVHANNMIQLDPRAQHFIMLAEICAAQGKITQSLQFLERAKKASLLTEQDYTHAIITEAKIYAETDQYDLFTQFCDKQIQENEKNQGLVLLLFSLKVKVYNKLKRYDKAIGLAYLLIEEMGEIERLQLDLAEIYRTMNEWQKSEEIYDKILWHDRQNVEALHGKGLCLLNKNILHEALQNFEKAIIYEPWNKNLREDLDATKKKLENEN